MVFGETHPVTQIDPCHQMINGGLLFLFLTKLLLGKKKKVYRYFTLREKRKLGWRNIKMMVAIETAI